MPKVALSSSRTQTGAAGPAPPGAAGILEESVKDQGGGMATMHVDKAQGRASRAGATLRMAAERMGRVRCADGIWVAAGRLEEAGAGRSRCWWFGTEGLWTDGFWMEGF